LGDSQSFQVDFQPVGRRGAVAAGQTLLEAAQQMGVELLSICGGKGDCGKCRVKLLQGSASPLTEAEKGELTEQEQASGFRLACQTLPLSDLKINVPPESLSTPQRIQVEGLEVPVTPNPPVIFYPVELSAPSLVDLTADLERCRTGLLSQHGVEARRRADVELMRTLSPRLRPWGWKARLGLRGDELVATVLMQAPRLGLTFDLGATKIAGYLVDLGTGKTLASKGAMNPQISYGEDLVTRLYRVHNAPDEACQMQKLAVNGLNGLGAEMCASTGAQPEEVAEAVVVANTAMHHRHRNLESEGAGAGAGHRHQHRDLPVRQRRDDQRFSGLRARLRGCARQVWDAGSPRGYRTRPVDGPGD
jgi:uncharacterized 2Fe-2S/4Fe-4S cluster protein (DUF4445 family)